MTSTQLHNVVTPVPKIAEHKNQARSSSEGFLARRPMLGLGLLLLGGMIFALLAFNVRTNGPLLTWDKPIDLALHDRATHDNQLDFFAMSLSGEIGKGIAIAVAILLAMYWLWKRHWAEISMLLIGMGGGSLWFVVLTNIFGRHRPVFPDPLESLPGPGFPSGHSMTSVLLYGLILVLLLPHLVSWRWRLLAVLDTTLIILLVGYSRLYMGGHYPTDVLGGYAFGLAWGALVYTSIELYRQRRFKQLGENPH